MLFASKLLNYIESEIGLQSCMNSGTLIDYFFIEDFESMKNEIVSKLNSNNNTTLVYNGKEFSIDIKFLAKLFNSFYKNYNQKFEEEKTFYHEATKISGEFLKELPLLYKEIEEKINKNSKTQIILEQQLKSLKNFKDYYVFNIL